VVHRAGARRQVRDGTRVSTAGTLNRALVQAIDARYGFGVTGKPPQSEAHVFQVTELRELARRLGLARRRATTLAATAHGTELAGDPVGMWNRLVDRALELPDFDRCVAETWLAAQVVDGPLRWPTIARWPPAQHPNKDGEPEAETSSTPTTPTEPSTRSPGRSASWVSSAVSVAGSTFVKS